MPLRKYFWLNCSWNGKDKSSAGMSYFRITKVQSYWSKMVEKALANNPALSTFVIFSLQTNRNKGTYMLNIVRQNKCVPIQWQSHCKEAISFAKQIGLWAVQNKFVITYLPSRSDGRGMLDDEGFTSSTNSEFIPYHLRVIIFANSPQIYLTFYLYFKVSTYDEYCMWALEWLILRNIRWP